VCLHVNTTSKSIHPYALPHFSLSATGVSPSLEKQLICKPIFENGLYEIGLNRRIAGPWQLRIPLDRRHTLAISTHFVSNYSDRQLPKHTLRFDYALMYRHGDKYRCVAAETSKWIFVKKLNRLGAPYFAACENTIRLSRSRGLVPCDLLNSEKVKLV
ncbi:Protein C15B12.2, partial [Aphelenchoides avenae]